MPTTVSRFEDYAKTIQELRYSHVVEGRKETWPEIAKRVVDNVLSVVSLSKNDKDAIYSAIKDRKLIPGGRMLSQAGREYHQTDNCFMIKAEDSREGWAALAKNATMMFMSGGGVGIDYSTIRPYGSPVTKTGSIASGPIPLIEMINGIGAAARQGGERRGAIYASLAWDHGDIDAFINLKTPNPHIQWIKSASLQLEYTTSLQNTNNVYFALEAIKESAKSLQTQFSPLQHTNISVRFDTNWLDSLTDSFIDKSQDNLFHLSPGYKTFHDTLKHPGYKTFHDTLKHACQYGDPGFQFDNDDQILRNACTEVISADSYDSCCLASLNLSEIDSINELEKTVELGIIFLLAATQYTDVPVNEVRHVKSANRRLGLGLMGVGEWFIQRDQLYGNITNNCDSDDFAYWLNRYRNMSDSAAFKWSNTFNMATPIATRAIAPTGTISIAGGMTTPGIEPVFHTAYKRTYNTLKTQESHDGLKEENIIDPVVQKWIEAGYDVEDIDTAYTLSQSIEGIERRIQFQAYVQNYVDNGISSTVNLPEYVEGIEDKIAPILLKYLPELRGITFYPNGAYENQPVKPIDIKDVLSTNSTLEQHDSCNGGICNV